MKAVAIALGALASLFWVTLGNAYAPDTHRQLSDDAASLSVLNNTLTTSSTTITTTLLQDIGISGFAKDTFPDSQVGQTVSLAPGLFASTLTAADNLNVEDLIRTGAALEDSGIRSFCHFYDPVSQSPLNFQLGDDHVASFTAPVWATGYSDPKPGSPITGVCNLTNIPSLAGFILPSPEQQVYSLKDANDYFYDALTDTNQDTRNVDFGKLFLSIGHALHLLEDMGQPQHVRNDMHCDSLACIPLGLYKPSEYEKFAYNHYDDVTYFNDNTGDSTPPDLSDMRSFWSTNDSAAKGLAEYTNQNFVSAGTIGSLTNAGGTNQYAKPAPTGTVSQTIDFVFGYIGTSVPHNIATYCANKACGVTFFTNTVYDNYLDRSDLNSWAASESIFNADLTGVNGHTAASLNAATYKSAENFLFQQIKGYSTGLINHFFRGRLGVTLQPVDPPSDPTQTYTLTYAVTNLSSVGLSNGALQVFYDSTDPSTGKVNRLEVPAPNVTATDSNGNGVDLTHLSLSANCNNGCNDSVSIMVPTNLNPAPDTPGAFMFVFKGTIGTEPGVAAKLFTPDYNPRLLVTYYNASPGIGGFNEALTLDANGKVTNYAFLGPSGCVPPFSTLVNCNSYMSGMSLYNGNIDAENPLYAVSNSTFNSLITNFSPTCSATRIGGIATNSQGTYILYERTSNCGSSGLFVDHYDLNNVKKSTITITAMDLVSDTNFYTEFSNSLSVNNDRMCILNNLNGEVELTDLNGIVIQQLAVAAGTAAFSCASTRDRHYVTSVDGNTGFTYLNIFDDNGNQINSMVADNQNFDQGQIAATNSDIYIPINNGTTTNPMHIIVIARHVIRNPVDGTITSETFTHQPDLVVTNVVGVASGVAVDMYNVLSLPTH
jgi:hypothetical protein